MNINATLLVQMLTFALFVWFTMKLVWPHITKALDERQTKIAEGLAAAERGHHELELAQHKVTEQLRDVKAESVRIIEKANRQSNHIVEEAKGKAREEGQRLLEVAKSDIDQEVNSAKRALRDQVAAIAVSGAEKILGREIDEAANAKLIDDLINEL